MQPDAAMAPLPFFDEAAAWAGYDAAARALPACSHNQAWRALGPGRGWPPDCAENRPWRAEVAAAKQDVAGRAGQHEGAAAVTAPYWASDDGDVTLHLGDCLDVLRTLPADSVDAIVTDPPAGISFMGRTWDTYGSRARFVDWLTERLCEALRVLKPGGHALVWSLPRTAHWTAWAVEDAGFEVRDCVLHVFGSGFPKSLDVGKAIDKRPGVVSHAEFAVHLAERREAAGLSRADVSSVSWVPGRARAGTGNITSGPRRSGGLRCVTCSALTASGASSSPKPNVRSSRRAIGSGARARSRLSA